MPVKGWAVEAGQPQQLLLRHGIFGIAEHFSIVEDHCVDCHEISR
jgi:hypothetical protein